MDSVALIRQLIERWNAGDTEGVLELYAEDGVMLSGSEWPEQTTWRGYDSGVDGRLPMAVVFTVRDGKIARHEWFIDHDRALAAARGD
jgi:ketosteroid isomerase-like protein